MPSIWSLAQVSAFVAFALTSSSDLIGQTENQLEQRYSHPIAFEVRPGVNAYPTFAADGNVCRMVIAKFPKVDDKLADINTTIPPALAKEIENELAPEDERGPELSPKPDLFRGGGTALIQKDYENVSIGVYSSRGNADAIAIVITWRYHTCSQ